MKKFLARLHFTTLLFFLCFPVFAEELIFKSTPEWVRERPLDDRNLKDPYTLEFGFEYLRNEIQNKHSLSGFEQYSRNAFAVHTMNAVNQFGNFSFQYIPAFQQYEINHIHLIRDGQVLDMKHRVQSQVISQDSNKQFDNDQLRTVVAIMISDVQIGDIIDYAVTITSRDPTYQGIIESAFNNTPLAISDVYRRTLVPKDIKLYTKEHAGHIQPTIHKTGEYTIYEWMVGSVDQLPEEQNVPAWMFLVPTAEYTNARDWGEIAKWGIQKFGVDPEIPEQVKQLAQRLTESATTDEELITAILQFTQSRIRYVGPGIGRNGHQPFTASQILQKKYGDCKDKAHVMVMLLRAVGIDAWPALVDSITGKIVSERLPSISAFNHVIVYVQTPGKEYFLDPTKLPIGSTKPSLLPVTAYSKALILKKDEDQLVSIPQAHDLEQKSQRLYTSLIDLTSGTEVPATLEFHLESNGVVAELMHNVRVNYGLSSFSKEELNHLKKHFDEVVELERMRPLATDNPDHLELVSIYQIPANDFITTGNGKYKLTYSACKIRESFRLPAYKNRKFPLALPHPFNLTEQHIFQLPEGSDKPEASQEEIDNDFFRFQKSVTTDGDQVAVNYSIHTKTDIVPVEALRAYHDEVKSLRDKSKTRLSWSDAAMAQSQPEIGLDELDIKMPEF